MSDTEKKIKLAEALGWSFHAPTDKTPFRYWIQPDGRKRYVVNREDIPFNPHTDANDCNALIKHLTEQQYCLTIDFWTGIVQLHKWNEQPVITAEGNNWMHGVCELALKVLP